MLRLPWLQPLAQTGVIYLRTSTVFTQAIRASLRRLKLDKITYEEMLEMASLGAKVLQTRSVELAMNHRVRLQVLSSLLTRLEPWS